MVLHIKWPSIQRLSNETCYITEKIDGTNGVIHVADDQRVTAGSRNGWITPDADNFGFAAWVRDHAPQLSQLGPGFHYGEWYGVGIQRGYGLTDRRFASFEWWRNDLPSCMGKVPLLAMRQADTVKYDEYIADLCANGSKLVPGFMDPEGIVIQFKNEREAKFKKFCRNDLIAKKQQVE